MSFEYPRGQWVKLAAQHDEMMKRKMANYNFS